MPVTDNHKRLISEDKIEGDKFNIVFRVLRSNGRGCALQAILPWPSILSGGTIKCLCSAATSYSFVLISLHLSQVAREVLN